MTEQNNDRSVSARQFLGVGSAAIDATVNAAATAAAQMPQDTEKAKAWSEREQSAQPMTMRKIIWSRRQKIPSCSLWYLALLLSLACLQSSRAGSASDAFGDSLDSLSAVEDYFSDWFKWVDEIQSADCWEKANIECA